MTRRRRSVRRAVLAALAVAGTSLALVRGAASGTIEEQRRRLPPPAPADTCTDPVEGLWQSQTYYPRQAEWYIFTLRVHRHDDRLEGEVGVHGWSGGPSSATPPAKCDGRSDYTLKEPAKGKITGQKLEFGGTSLDFDPPRCGRVPPSYVVDTFVGTIDPALQEFQSVNRYPSGGEMLEDITVFRRIECFGAPPTSSAAAPATALPPPAPPVPPAASPAAKPLARFGCSCGP